MNWSLRREYHDEPSPYEVVTPTYVLVIDPQKSQKISHNLKKFAANHNINSILYVPLEVGEEVTHFMTFDALDLRKGYSQWEIEIFLFLGRELMQAQRMEQLDDTLHDFKNPAIAIAGFARRLKTLLDKSIPLNETRVHQEIPGYFGGRDQSDAGDGLKHPSGRERQIVNLTEILKKRFEINQEVIKEMLKANVTLQKGPFHDPLTGALLSHSPGTYSGQPA